MCVEKLPTGRWAVCEDDGTTLQTWKTERLARFDLYCYRKDRGDGNADASRPMQVHVPQHGDEPEGSR
jgi:hypothetical protein